MKKLQIFSLLLVAFAAGGIAEAAIGDNRIVNPSFETDEKAFKWKRMESPRKPVEAKDDPRYIARFDGGCAKSGKRAWFMRCENTQGRNIMRFTSLAVTPGKPYTFKAYYRIEDADGLRTVWGNYHEHNAAGKTSGYKNLDRFSTETGKWNEFGCTFYASPGSVTADVELIFIGRMSVRVDEVSFVEQVEPEPLPVIGGKLPGSDLFSLSWLSPLSKALPCGVDGRLEDGDGAVHLDAARNEAESFQLVLGAKRYLKNVELEVSDFVFEKSGDPALSGNGRLRIPQSAVKIREVLFVLVSGVSNPGMNRLHPDPVVDYSQGDAAAGSNKVFLVTVKTPADAAAGAYAGTLSLRVGGGEAVRIPVKLRVRDFVLPDTAKLKSYFYFSPSAFLNSYGRYDGRPEKEVCDDMYRHYRELRLTGNQAVKLPVPEWTMKDGHVVVTGYSAYEAEVERLNKEFGLTVFPVPFVGMLGDNQGWFKGGRGTKTTSDGRVVGLGPKETPFGGFFDEPEGQRRVIEALSQFAKWAKTRFPNLTFSWYIYDEPSEAVMDVLPKLVKTYVDALPEIKFLVVHTHYADRLERYDIRVATFNPSSINPQVRNFDTSWYYQYPAVITDDEYLKNRFFPYQVYLAGGEGVLLWSVAYYGKPNPKRPKLKFGNPWLNPAVAYESAYTTLFYPPRQGKNEGVVSTMRAINIGDGIDDFDYLKLYEENFGKENLEKLIKTVMSEATAMPSDPAAFLKLRSVIADRLEGQKRMRWSVRDAENGALLATDIAQSTVTVDRDGEVVFETWIESPAEHRRKCLVSLPDGGEVLVNGERTEPSAVKFRKGWNHVAVRTFRTMSFYPFEALDGCKSEAVELRYSSTPPLHAFIQRWGDNLVSGENPARFFRDIPVSAGRFYCIRTEPRVDGTCRFVDASGGEYRRFRLSDCTQFYPPPGATSAEIMLDSEAKLRFFEDAEPPAVPVPHPDPLSYNDVTSGAPDDRFQREIDAAAERGGGEVRVPAGVWHVKPLVLKSNVTLHFARGAVLLASVEPSDYDPKPHRRAFIYAEDAENVGISGEGVIDGRGYAFRELGRNMTGASQPQTLPKLMCFNRCRNVRLEGFTYRRGGAWGCHLRNCDGVVMRRVKCFNHINKTNDGIDIESSNVLVEDCDIDADDDAIAVKSESDPLFAVTNITVRNCRLASMAYPFKIGTGSYGDVRDILVEDCVFPRTKMNHRFAWSKLVAGITNDISGICGIGIQCVDGGRLENVTVRNVSMEGYGVPLSIRLGRRHEPGEGKKTYLRNVLIENVTAVAEGPTASSIVGAKGLEVEDVTLRNVKITLAGGATAADAGSVFPNDKGYPGPNMFKSVLPAAGLFVKDAVNVDLENVNFEFVREDERPLIVGDVKRRNFTRVEVGPESAPTNRIVRRVDLPPIRIPRFARELKALGTGGLTPVDGHSGSFAFLCVVEPESRRGVVAGWLTNEKASGIIQSGFDEKGNVVIKPFAEYGLMEVPANTAVYKDIFIYGYFDDCRKGLEQYAELIAKHYRISLPRQISGYTTWYDDVHGYSRREGAGTAASAKEFADAAVRHNLKAYGLDFYQIDDFWQAGRTDINGPARNFFRCDPNGPFPDGFKATTSYFTERGMIPGLWIMPFGGLSKEPFFADKQDIFATAAATTPGAAGRTASDAVGRAVAQTAGAPFETAWGGTIIDLTRESGRKYVADLCRLITCDWGFRYIKFDGLWTGHGGDLLGGATWRNDHYDNIVRSDMTKSGVEAFRAGVRTIREASAPGTFLLACNSAQNARSIAASYGLVDAMRIGGDNGPIDEFPDRYLNGTIAATPRYFYNGRVWYNDPDPIYVRDAVAFNRARLFASWAGVSGLLYNFSDWLPNLSTGRVELLKRTMAPHGVRECRPVDYFENLMSRVWEVGDGECKVFGLFNWNTNSVLKIDYPAHYVGLKPDKTYVGFDYWNNKFIPPFKGRLSAEVPADDCRVVAVHELLDRPFVISTSRHVVSPLFDVKEERWDPVKRTLSGVSRVVPGERYELRIVDKGCIRRFEFLPEVSDFSWSVGF